MDETRRESGLGSTIGRRAFLHGAAVAALPLAGAGGRGARTEEADGSRVKSGERTYPGQILRGREPKALEFPFPTLDSVLTPNEQFYVLSHFAEPTLEAPTWRLKVEGAVDRPLELTYDELRQRPSRTMAATLECSGNGRVFLLPKARGTPWELGGVSTAEWTGVPLADVLERAGVREGAVEVILQGADAGKLDEEPKTPGVIPFARSVPLDKARDPDVLLAYRMNGEDLPRPHGFPVRALVPGWHGVASVKWLTRIVVTDRPFRGYFQSMHYSYYERRDGLPSLVPVTEVRVKASIARPSRSEVVAKDTDYRVLGAAWAGESDVSRVEVSTDGGRSWADATLLGAPVRYVWRLWEFPWHTPKDPGPRVVMARATDGLGRVQPMRRDPDLMNYMIHHVVPIEVHVR